MRKRLLVAFGIVMAGYAEQIPVTGGVTLSGQAVQVPGSLTARHSLLIIGFTAKSGAACNAWMKRVRPEVCASDSSAACYQIAVLASVPRLVRGLVLRAMKKGTDAQEQRSFLPIFEKEKEWKGAAGYAEPDDAYVLVVSRSGEVEWKTHGVPSEERFARLA